ncbi:MAG: alpha-galactosidase [Ruminococcaceae bacterium]|nr:alpha-galactosidase [Oscillospiraceae bacterium]
MEFLKSQNLFHFHYDGKPFSELKYTVSKTVEGNVVTSEYIFEDGLKITNIATKHEDNLYEWVNWLENISDGPTKQITSFTDSFISMPLPKSIPVPTELGYSPINNNAILYSPKGSCWAYDEFGGNPVSLTKGNSRKIYASAGRCSAANAPFFNVHCLGKGYIFAIGWTGFWKCTVERTDEGVDIRTKINSTNFHLLPGEKFRTSSFVIMSYEGTVAESQNQWRRCVKKHFSLIGQEGREQYGPLSAGIWGGMRSASVIERVETFKKYDLPYDFVWMDAGWYGRDTKPTPNEFDTEWAQHTGDWCVSPLIHTNNLKDVSKAIHNAGMKFLLWFEPERVPPTAPIISEHPEYFLEIKNENYLLNLGDPVAWQYCFDTISGLIEEIGLDGYRQDFNYDPMAAWESTDSEGRNGITEIKHINGLYRYWDALLEKFPHLLIDNCASGGTRIDIETIRRSIPLWRSDVQCTADYPEIMSQCHNRSYSYWLPYSGTGSGRPCNQYRIRSAHAPAMANQTPWSESEKFGDDENQMLMLKKYLDEYKTVRPYLSEDFYPLTDLSNSENVWSAIQYNRPEQNDGILEVYRRKTSPYETAIFKLYGLDKSSNYIFRDADDNSEVALSGAELLEHGLSVTIKEQFSSKIYFYKKA